MKNIILFILVIISNVANAQKYEMFKDIPLQEGQKIQIDSLIPEINDSTGMKQYRLYVELESKLGGKTTHLSDPIDSVALTTEYFNYVQEIYQQLISAYQIINNEGEYNKLFNRYDKYLQQANINFWELSAAKTKDKYAGVCVIAMANVDTVKYGEIMQNNGAFVFKNAGMKFEESDSTVMYSPTYIEEPESEVFSLMANGNAFVIKNFNNTGKDITFILVNKFIDRKNIKGEVYIDKSFQYKITLLKGLVRKN